MVLIVAFDVSVMPSSLSGILVKVPDDTLNIPCGLFGIILINLLSLHIFNIELKDQKCFVV